MCAFLYECLTYTFLYKCLTYTFPSPACAGLFCVRILDRPANKNALRETKARYGKPRRGGYAARAHGMLSYVVRAGTPTKTMA